MNTLLAFGCLFQAATACFEGGTVLVTYPDYPGAEGCYDYLMTNEYSGRPDYPRFQMANGNQLYVANYYGEDGAEEGYNLSYDTDEGQSVICTSNRFQSLGSVLDLNTIGWNYCFQYPDDDEWDVAGLEVSCGCDTGDGDDATASSAQEQDNSASQYTSSWVTVAGNICILIFVAVESILL